MRVLMVAAVLAWLLPAGPAAAADLDDPPAELLENRDMFADADMFEMLLETPAGEEDRATIERQLREMASLQQDIDALRRVREELEARVGTLAASMDALAGELGQTRDRSQVLEARLADSDAGPGQ